MESQQRSAAQLETLVDRLMQRRLVPLAGAGISIACSTVETDWQGSRWHDVSHMSREIARRVHCWNSGGRDPQIHRLAHEAGPRLGDLVDLATATLQRLRRGSTETPECSVVKLLRISDYVDLTPTRAHRAMAFLGREGLLPEVLTTNYDACFERAWFESFGEEHPVTKRSSSDIRSEEHHWRLARACELTSYRAHGNAQTSPPKPAFRVVKLNGCAIELHSRMHHCSGSSSGRSASRGSEGRCYCSSILLGSRQLERWRDRQWAADILRDRLRSCTMLFTGFGSDEPQVRQTVSLIQEEFGGRSELQDGVGHETRLLKQANALFISVYDQKGSNFIQWQSASVYRQAHAQRGDENELLVTAAVTNSFRYVRAASDERLPADELWQELHARCIERVVRRALTPDGSGFGRTLLNFLPRCGRNVLGEMLSWFFPARAESGPLDSDRESFIEAALRWDSIVGEDQSSVGVPAFSRWLESAEPQEAPKAGRYVPLHERIDDFLWMAFWAWALDLRCPAPDAPLCAWTLAAPRSSSSDIRRVLFVRGWPSGAHLRAAACDALPVVFIRIGTEAGSVLEYRSARAESEKVGATTARLVLATPLRVDDVLCAHADASTWEIVRRAAWHAVLAPATVIRRSEPSLRGLRAAGGN